MSKIKEKKKKEKKKNKMAGISNEAIDDFFEKVNDDDIKNNFIGVFSSNKINKFISYHSIIKDRKVKYPFIIMNTDRSDRPGTHWWSFLDLHPNNKILFNLDKFEKADRKITLISLKFSMREYEKIKDTKQLTTTTQDLLHLMYEFGKLHNIQDEITVFSLDDQLQKIETDTCGIFQIYFYYNLFNPFTNSSVIKDKVINKHTIEKLLNEIFTLSQEKNERVIQQFAVVNNIR